MHIATNELNKNYGRLTVIANVSRPGGGAYWLCQCTCGNQCVVRGSTLRSGRQKSCGCLVKDTMSLPEGESLKHQILDSFKDSAKNRDLVWEISDDYALALAFSNCEYCGSEPSNNMRGQMKYNGIDRIDSKIGYTYDNVVTCCKTCNMAKRTMSVDDFMEWVRRVYNHSITEKRNGV